MGGQFQFLIFLLRGNCVKTTVPCAKVNQLNYLHFHSAGIKC